MAWAEPSIGASLGQIDEAGKPEEHAESTLNDESSQFMHDINYAEGPAGALGQTDLRRATFIEEQKEELVKSKELHK